jgi:replicative DNA helicase
MTKLSKSMVETKRPVSEAEALDDLLNELQREHQVREIAGWDTGFATLNGALDGIFPGLYLLIGSPGCGKTSFAKQLLDRVAMRNEAAGIFISFAESKKEIRIKTLARLSGIENKEIRRGSAYLLHWYGVPRLGGSETEQLSPSWERVRLAAENARSWLESVFLLECFTEKTLEVLESEIQEIRAVVNKPNTLVVIDDCQRLGISDQPIQTRLTMLIQQLQVLAKKLNMSLLAVWPDLKTDGKDMPQMWADGAPGVDVVMVMEPNSDRTKKLTPPARGVNLHIVKNRGGDRGTLLFDFEPAFCRFTEVIPR